MTDREWSEFWSLMDKTFRNRKVSKDERPMYQAALADATLDQLKDAVLAHAKQNRFLPDIAELARFLPQTTKPIRDKVQIDADLRLWYEQHVAKFHEAGVPTAVECKKRGISVIEFMERADRAGL